MSQLGVFFNRIFVFPNKMIVNLPNLGIGLSFFLSLNELYFHAGGGIDIALGKLR